MHLDYLYVRNFRNYEEAHICFGPRINLIQGPNAQGKTNLLEALFFLSTGKSFRTPHLTDLIRHQESYFYLEIGFLRDSLPQTLKVYFDPKQRKIHYNNTLYHNFSSLLGLIPLVLFAPEDISLIGGAPSERRRFLNLHIAQTDPLYVHHLVRYTQAMRQRNQLLKQKKETAIETWETMMSLSAAYLILKRQEMIKEFASPLSLHMDKLSLGNDVLKIEYLPSFFKEEKDLSQAFQNQLSKQRKREMLIGSTLIGPHRDDVHITIGEKQAKLYSSEGQKRSCISAIRLAEWERLSKLAGVSPLMCIDDFGVHLDASRQRLFQEYLGSLHQVFLTSPFDVSLATHKLYVEKGKITSLNP